MRGEGERNEERGEGEREKKQRGTREREAWEKDRKVGDRGKRGE